LGYAEMRFDENAHLVLARAVEQSGSEALASLPEAWLVEDRTITLNVEVDTARGEMIAVKRLLTALLLEAEQGEAVIEVPPFERWSRDAGPAPSLNQMFAGDTDIAAAPFVQDSERGTPRQRSQRGS
jgi:hypothetical protein